MLRIEQFLKDIKKVNIVHQNQKDLREHYQRLIPFFKSEKSNLEERYKNLLEKIPSSHPLNCPITLFGPMGYDRWEVAYTKTLAYLLSPEKMPKTGEILCRNLITQLIGEEFAPSKVINVHSEKAVLMSQKENRGRIDIELSFETALKQKCLIVIEAKVDADEGERQLERYEKYVLSQSKNYHSIFPVYLTPDSIKNKKAKTKWKFISYEVILTALEQTITDSPDSMERNYLTLFAANILKDILGLDLNGKNATYNKFKILSRYHEVIS